MQTITPGFTATGFVEHMKDSELKAQMERSRDEIAMTSRTLALAVAYAIDQPDDVDVAEIIIRSTAQA